MTIYIIARGYPSVNDPVWGCFEKDQAEALASLGHKVVILAVDTRLRMFRMPLTTQEITANGVSVYNIIAIPHAFLFFLSESNKNALSTILLNIVYKRAIATHGIPDVLYSHYLYNTQCATFLKKKYNIPLIGIEHWSHLGKMPIPKEIQKIAVNIYPQLDLLISVSTALRKNIQEQIGTDSIVIPNMLGHEFLHKTKNEHRNNKIKKIITTGRLVEGKKFDLLIRALSNINTPYDLNIIGNGPIKNKLELLIQQLNLTEKIHLLGHKNKDELVCLLEQSDLFVLPSQSETFGVSYIEALACGLPIIATDCGGPKDFVTKENGLLIPTNNLEALKNAIEFMIEHINDYDKVAIAEDCKKRFSPKMIAKELTLIFEKIINKNKNN